MYTVCFIIYQYLYGNQSVNSNFDELINYIKHHNITIHKNEMVLSGRLCKDIDLGDILFTKNGVSIIVKGLFAYGHAFQSLEAGMTCVILSNLIDYPFYLNETLYLVN